MDDKIVELKRLVEYLTAVINSLLDGIESFAEANNEPQVIEIASNYRKEINQRIAEISDEI